MPKEQLRYDRMVEGALRGVVREAVREAAERGLPGNHHFYLTFRTALPGVKLPEHLHTQYPNEMTIVLQYQFFDLEVTPEAFSVTLSFSNINERLTIPFTAITTFADPSVNFALQFQPLSPQEAAQTLEKSETKATEPTSDPHKPASEAKRGEVVTLDAFRKK